MDLLGHIQYTPAQRNQGGCGNCWVWASTGVIEIAHHVENNVLDRLSIQYFDSCNGGDACCGGNPTPFATWYASDGRTIPWSNTNASFADGARGCGDPLAVSCASIATTPEYPLVSISPVNIDTHSGQAAAIANIKNILDQNRGIYFGFALPDAAAWGDFFDFWDGVSGETEGTLWTNSYCGTEWNESPGQAGGHAVVILGYNDDDPDPANHYWLALNSWGTAGGVRPNVLFRVPMQMNYDCSYPDNGTPGYWAMGFTTFDVEFANALPVSDAGGPYSAECDGSATAVTLDGSGSSDPEGAPLTFEWTTDCPDSSFDDTASATPVLTIDTGGACHFACNVTLTVTDSGALTDSDATTVTVDDTLAPAVAAPPPLTIECTTQGGVPKTDATVAAWLGQATATDACGTATLNNDAPDLFPSGCGPGAGTTVTFTGQDTCGNTDSATSTLTVTDTTAPTLVVPPPIVLECSAQGGVPKDSPQVVAWLAGALASDTCGAVAVTNDAPDIFPSGCAPGVTTTVTFTATDACGNTTALTSTVTVQDTTPPVIVVQPSIGGGCAYLWPPNHGYVDFTIANTGIVAQDACDGVLLEFSSCASSQPEDARGMGDGSTTRDCLMDGTSIHLRAERDGACGALGRTYTMTVDATDACGNRARSLPFQVGVPHDMGHRGPGQKYPPNPKSNKKAQPPGVNGTYGSDCGAGFSCPESLPTPPRRQR